MGATERRSPRSAGRSHVAGLPPPVYTVTPPPGYGLHDGCVFHTNRECRNGPAAALTDNELRAYLTNHRNQTTALTNAVSTDQPPDIAADTHPPATSVAVNATGAQLRNRMVVEARTAARPKTIEPAPADHVPRPTTPAEVLQDGSTACCNRERCPGLEVCLWRNPHSIGNVEQWRKRYTNAEVYGAERAAHTQAVYDAHRTGQPIPMLADFRQQHPELRGTSTHRRPFNSRLRYVSASVQITAEEEDYGCDPLTDDLADSA